MNINLDLFKLLACALFSFWIHDLLGKFHIFIAPSAPALIKCWSSLVIRITFISPSGWARTRTILPSWAFSNVWMQVREKTSHILMLLSTDPLTIYATSLVMSMAEILSKKWYTKRIHYLSEPFRTYADILHELLLDLRRDLRRAC